MRTSVNVSLPEPMADWIDRQVKKGIYGTTSEVVRDAIRALQDRRVRERIDARLLEALDSGKPLPVNSEFWEARRQTLKRRTRKTGKP